MLLALHWPVFDFICLIVSLFIRLLEAFQHVNFVFSLRHRLFVLYFFLRQFRSVPISSQCSDSCRSLHFISEHIKHFAQPQRTYWRCSFSDRWFPDPTSRGDRLCKFVIDDSSTFFIKHTNTHYCSYANFVRNHLEYLFPDCFELCMLIPFEPVKMTKNAEDSDETETFQSPVNRYYAWLFIVEFLNELTRGSVCSFLHSSVPNILVPGFDSDSCKNSDISITKRACLFICSESLISSITIIMFAISLSWITRLCMRNVHKRWRKKSQN